MSRDYRAEFMAKSQAMAQGDQARIDSDEERAFQSKLDACSSPREQYILKSQYLAEHGRFPSKHSDQAGHTSRQSAGVNTPVSGRTDQQAGKDPRADYLRKLQDVGMNNGELFQRESKQDSVTVRRVHRFDGGGYLDFSGGENISHTDSAPIPGAVRVQRFDTGRNAGYLL